MNKPAPLLPPLPDDRTSGLEMPHYVVSTRPLLRSDWPIRDYERIGAAKIAYDRGHVEVCQGKQNGLFVLYAIPRKVRAAPRRFFFDSAIA